MTVDIQSVSFNEILQDAEKTFRGVTRVADTDSSYEKQVWRLTCLLNRQVDSLIIATGDVFTSPAFRYSKLEKYSFVPLLPPICGVGISPSDEGIDMELRVALEKRNSRAVLRLNLLLKDYQSKKAFLTFYRAQPFALGLLFEQARLRLTARPKSEHEGLKRIRSIFKQIDYYFRAWPDRGGQLGFRKEFSGNVDPQAVLESFLTLTALYDCIYSASQIENTMEDILRYHQVSSE